MCKFFPLFLLLNLYKLIVLLCNHFEFCCVPNYYKKVNKNRMVAGLVGIFRNDGGLGTGQSYIPVVFFDPLLHRSPCLLNVDFAPLAGNPVDYATLFSSVDGVLWSH